MQVTVDLVLYFIAAIFFAISAFVSPFMARVDLFKLGWALLALSLVL